MTTLVARLWRDFGRLVFTRHGPLARDLVREPGGFGLGQVPQRLKPDATARTICGFCSTGCSLDVHLRGEQAVNVSPTTDYPVNLGMACPKGWEQLTPLRSADRLTTPLLRDGSGVLQPVSWERAMAVFVDRLRKIQREHGPDSLAFLSTGQISSEEMALLGAVAKFGMGIRHGDGNTRQCMATAVVAYKQAFGFDAPPYTYDDFEQSDLLIFVGANPCIAHPIMWERVCRNRNDPAVVVVDPRRTETAMAARMHLSPWPKSDLALFYGVAKQLIDKGFLDHRFIAAHTSGFSTYAEHVASYGLSRVAAATGVPGARIEELAERIYSASAASFWWTMGVNQSHQGVATAHAIIALALMTGNIGRPGTGANSITGQCNAMGSRLFSNTTSLYAGRDFANPSHREQVAGILGIDAGCVPPATGMAYDQIMDAVDDRRVRGLWVVATNPAHSWIDQGRARSRLDKLEFLVVQDLYGDTETARHAHLVLPAAGAGEKLGSFINSERRLGHLKRVSRPPGEALADFYVFKLVAQAWGCGQMFERWTTPAAAFDILRDLSRGTPCDFTAVRDLDELDTLAGVQWPAPEGMALAVGQQRRLFADGQFFHQDGRARFITAEPTPSPEVPDPEYPLCLLTGRGSSAQWHTQTRTARSPQLRRLSAADVYVEINPEDAAELSVSRKQWVRVCSRRGEVRARAVLTPSVPRGHVFMPMHYEAVNRLTLAAFDPASRQPAYKACAVRIGS